MMNNKDQKLLEAAFEEVVSQLKRSENEKEQIKKRISSIREKLKGRPVKPESNAPLYKSSKHKKPVVVINQPPASIKNSTSVG